MRNAASLGVSVPYLRHTQELEGYMKLCWVHICVMAPVNSIPNVSGDALPHYEVCMVLFDGNGPMC